MSPRLFALAFCGLLVMIAILYKQMSERDARCAARGGVWAPRIGLCLDKSQVIDMEGKP